MLWTWFGPQARAKVELREHVTEQDAKDVVDMMQEVSHGTTEPPNNSPYFLDRNRSKKVTRGLSA